MLLRSSLAVHPTDILDDLRRRQFSVTVEDGQLLIRPAGRLQPDDREHIAANRDELVALLVQPVDHEADGVCRDISKQDESRSEYGCEFAATLDEVFRHEDLVLALDNDLAPLFLEVA